MRLERGDKVALLMDNGLLTAQLLFGAMYGGLVSVPLNVHAGVSQLSYTLDHCDAKVVFVEEKYTDLIKEVLATVRRVVGVIFADIDRLVAEQGAPPMTPPTVPATEDVALLMYTSGSTGQPKGAIHTHGTILAQAKTSVASHELTLSDRSLLVLPLYHINAECVTLIPTLMSGGSVVVPHRLRRQRILELDGRPSLHLVGRWCRQLYRNFWIGRTQRRIVGRTAFRAHPLLALRLRLRFLRRCTVNSLINSNCR